MGLHAAAQAETPISLGCPRLLLAHSPQVPSQAVSWCGAGQLDAQSTPPPSGTHAWVPHAAARDTRAVLGRQALATGLHGGPRGSTLLGSQALPPPRLLPPAPVSTLLSLSFSSVKQ